MNITALDPASPECQTPLMKQFIRLKEEGGDALLFFRMGDFYELFGPDAVIAAPILGITLTSRNKNNPNPIPMAGLPFHSATNYIQKLLSAGKKVAIAEQILPEGMTTDQIKGIVERKIVRVFTPAVQFELSGDARAKFLATVSVKNQTYQLILLDPATGEVRISESLAERELIGLGAWDSVKHFVLSHPKTPSDLVKELSSRADRLIDEVASNFVTSKEVIPFLHEQYGKKALHPLLEDENAAHGLAILVKYVLKSQGIETLSHLKEARPLHESDRLVVGPHTHDHLDSEDLFTLINQTATSMGARFLKAELNAPLKTVAAIEKRQEAVKELARESLTSAQIHQALKEVYDLDRILGRVVTRLASPRDTYALGQSLSKCAELLSRLELFASQRISELRADGAQIADVIARLSQRILTTQKADAPTHTREGGIFEFGTNAELDRLLKLTTEGERFLIELETREREATGISSLKVKYNRVFGYFIEISSANLKNAPTHYQRKQTMVGGERFFTEELKKFEEEILSASSKQRALESKLFDELVGDLISEMSALKTISGIVAESDALIALSQLALKSGWNFPVIDDSTELTMIASRHPVVDHALGGQFVPNDIEMGTTARTIIITGPNMGGKSTLMRQMAQVILLGQMGAPVPAKSAKWGVFHSLYTRIGAHDAIARGQSTFMVEMVELGHILDHADARSFVILDEIGRGTSTFDGMSVARASLEYLHQKSGARIVFATHYHELTDLEAELPGIKNAYMKVLDEKGRLTFLYELALGRSSKSFGIQVAELAGLPKSVIKKSWQILEGLENGASTSVTPQLSLFSVDSVPQYAPIPESLKALKTELEGYNINSSTPLQAMMQIEKWKQLLS